VHQEVEMGRTVDLWTRAARSQSDLRTKARPQSGTRRPQMWRLIGAYFDSAVRQAARFSTPRSHWTPSWS